VANKRILGLDTSNYTTSTALFDNELTQAKRLLPVKSGELGLRQSDALFHHIKNLPELLGVLLRGEKPIEAIEAIEIVGVSVKPRNIDGSYMPCFLAGESLADSLAATMGAVVYKTSHQVGHILAALYAANRLDLTDKTFCAFHIRGGTTDMLLCSPDNELLIKCELLCASADLKAGQLIDRVGVMLGLTFPCGAELERLAALYDGTLPKINIPKNGGNYCFSGAENICEKMQKDGEPPEKIAAYAIAYVTAAVSNMIKDNLPEDVKTIVFCGGVMSDKIIQNELGNEFTGYELIFTPPEFSCDNAVGAAIFAAIKSQSGSLSF
jgi:N6-L-threonylcarbamoyladenine synthase